MNMLQRIHELGAVLISVGRIGLTAGRYNFFNTAAGEFRSELPQRKYDKLRICGTVSCQQMVDRRAEAVDIGPSVCLTSSAKLLRCSVASCAQPGRIPVIVLLVFSRRSKVDQHDLSIGAEHYVRRLHVSVDNRRNAAVEISKHIAELLCPVNNCVDRLRTARVEKILQALSFYIVHDNNETVICIYNIDDAGEIGVVKLLEHFCLCNQPLAHHFLIVSAILAHFFDRPGLIGALIERKVHDAHTAVSDFIQYFILSVQYGTHFKHRSVFLSKLMGFNKDGTDIIILVSLYVESDQIGDPSFHDLR